MKKHHAALAALSFVFGIGLPVLSTAYDQVVQRRPGAETDKSATSITGELLKIEDKNYVIRDGFGKEVRLRVTTETKVEGSPKVGDKIEAKVSEGGQANSIKVTTRSATDQSSSSGVSHDSPAANLEKPIMK